MKKINHAALLLFLSSLLFSSCSAVAGIFKAGMGFGIIAVIAFLVILVFVFTRGGKK
ncbi:MAG: hypothetical protein ABUT20_54705 [Bacteroidota bacterium]